VRLPVAERQLGGVGGAHVNAGKPASSSRISVSVSV
jgi:hypothetical protein